MKETINSSRGMLLRSVWPLLSLLLATTRTCQSAPPWLRTSPAIITHSSYSHAKTFPLSIWNNNDMSDPLLSLRGGANADADGESKKKKKTKAKKKATTTSISSTSKSSKKSTSSATVKTKKKKSKAKKVTVEDADDITGKSAIEEALGKDFAQTLGDAIRDRADELRSETILLQRIDQSVQSVGWALGASDRGIMSQVPSSLDGIAPDAGVAGSPTSVLVSYFMKSHGGAHAVQCVCGLLSGSAGVASLLASNPVLRRVLMKRMLVFAMAKHVAGLLGAAMIAGRAIPEVGLRKARVWMERLARDPVSQYVFYSACILLWLPTQPQQPLVAGFKNDNLWISLVFMLPVLLRELISTMLVISDVLVLWNLSSDHDTSSNNNKEDVGSPIESILQIGQQAVDVGMSLLVTPERWKSADPAGRQVILAKLTSRASLALEVMVGLILVWDVAARMLQIIFGTTTTSAATKPSPLLVMKRLMCARIYLQFLTRRRRNIRQLAVDLRGGSVQLPFYVLDVLMDPIAAMGLSTKGRTCEQQQQLPNPQEASQQSSSTSHHTSTTTSPSTTATVKGSRQKGKQKTKSHGIVQGMDWKDLLWVVLGLDDV